MFSPSTVKCTSLSSSDIVIAVGKGNAEFPLKDIEKYKDTTVLDIGTYNGKRLVCLNLPDLEGGVPLRTFFSEAEPEIAHIAILAAHLSWWKALYKYCPKCGKPLKEHNFERCMTCQACEENFYPVISPAIIVLITKENRILLAHNTKFPPKRHSLLAGFVEPGESLETAVHREVMEETGIRIKNLRYLESQPWPFPNSLMAAFAAEWESGELKPDGVEIEGAAWYASSDELPDLPPKGSIARKLIDSWIMERHTAIFAE
ncbi:MAG: NAD(+) diphosphatase [Fibromonadaceae bacterium]|jgi:NAD+ diphosphatase|nr:NAD(+) diphosphatase [Fibromonadaceae bacterium]